MQDSNLDCDKTDLYTVKAEISCENGIASSSGVQFSGFLEKIDSVLCNNFSIGSESGSHFSEIQESNIAIAHESSFDLSPEASVTGLSSRDDEHSLLASNGYAATRNSVKRVKRDHLPLNVDNIVKVESVGDCAMENNGMRDSIASEQVQVKRKVETHDDAHDENELKLSSRLNLCTSAPNSSSLMKNEAETACELDEDEIDHMKLIDRLKLHSSHGSGHHENLNSPSSGFSFCTSDEYVKPLRILRPWKRKKTAT